MTGVTTSNAKVTKLFIVGCITYELMFEKEKHQTGFAFPAGAPDNQGRLTNIGPGCGKVAKEKLQLMRSGVGADIFTD